MSFVPRLLIAALLFIAACSNCLGQEYATLAPKEDAILENNAPVLAWTPGSAESVEVWMDGAKIAELAGDVRQYVPFPLGRGTHEWQVVYVKDGTRTAARAAHFTVSEGLYPLNNKPGNATDLCDGWKMQSAYLAGEDGAVISSPSCDVAGWYPATLPTTALGTLVRNGVYPNPYYGLNNTLIPDASDAFNKENDLLRFSHVPGKNPWAAPYWFRRTFTAPEHVAGRRVCLVLNEINYRADVWLNGSKIADGEAVVGMERRFRFDVTEHLVPGENVLAIAVHPVDHPGKPDPCPVTPLGDPGTNMADGEIALNYTKFDTLGWDWLPEVRDRDMGITDEVYLHVADRVELENLYVSPDLPLPDVSTADLFVSCDVVNHGDTEETGTLSVTLVGPNQKNVAHFVKPYSVKAGETLTLRWTSEDTPALHLTNPALWWPWDMGGQPLYTLIVTRNAPDTTCGLMERFGVREVETFLLNGALGFKINGKREYVRGGCWVPDMCLTWTASRYFDEVKLARQSGLNFLRVWGPSGVPPEAFYDAADQFGILVQQDFLNDYWGMQKNDPRLIPPENLFADASAQIVRKGRNHPSVVVWCGGNEGLNQREKLLLKKILPENDPHGLRHYLRASDSFGLTGHGPYWNLTPKGYFASDRMTGFNGEIGPSGVPEIESLEKFLPEPDAWREGRFPLDGVWAYHDATNRDQSYEMRRFSFFDDILRRFYGSPTAKGWAGVSQYAAKAQLVNYESYRSVMEALNRKLWRDVTGFALWKSNAAWPSITWQLNDWYMQPNAGFYAVRKSCEPVHIQLNRDTNTVTVVNRREEALKGAKISAVVYDAALKQVFAKSEDVSLPAQGVSESSWSVPEGKAVTFLRLKLLDADGVLLSDNFYWLSAKDDFSSLGSLPEPELRVTSTVESFYRAPFSQPSMKVRTEVTNTGKTLAFMLRAKLVDVATGLEVLPTCWSDNYFTLLPGESRVLEAEADFVPDQWRVEVQGTLNRE
jgi:hypothetical protein